MRTDVTPRQSDILALKADGLGTGEISARLGISRRTIYHHMHAIYRRLAIDAEQPGPVAVARWVRGEIGVRDRRWGR